MWPSHCHHGGEVLPPLAWQQRGVVLAAQAGEDLDVAVSVLKSSCPTAVNLLGTGTHAEIPCRSKRWIRRHCRRQPLCKRTIALAPDPVTAALAFCTRSRVLHHCHTGAIATAGVGTALGVIAAGHARGVVHHAWLDETRPRLQGAALSAWELGCLGVPCTVIVDGASGLLMRRQEVDAVLVGCDRVAANGDVANKVGTYNLALVARAHGIPFYVCAPGSSLDLTTPDGDAITIEERPEERSPSTGAVGWRHRGRRPGIPPSTSLPPI